MIIIGAKGFAKEVLEIAHQLNLLENLVFFDDISEDTESLVYNQFKVLRTESEVKAHFTKFGNEYTLGVGNPKVRELLEIKFNDLGGELVSLISPKSDIGHYGNTISNGTIIASGCVLTNSITVKRGCLINLNTTIGHDVIINEFVEICPGVNVSGNVQIGKNTFVGTNATILPKIKIGENCIIAAGTVVTKNVADNSLIAGVPGILVKTLT